MANMTTLLTLPFEIRSQIISYVLNDHIQAPHIFSPYRLPSNQTTRAYNASPLLLTSHQLYLETTAQLSRIPTNFHVDTLIIDKSRLVLPTWTFIPYRSRSIDSLEITLRTLDIGIPWMRQLPCAADFGHAQGGDQHGPLAKILLNALNICTFPVRRSKGQRYAPPTIQSLVLNIVTPEWLRWEYDEPIGPGDMISIFGPESEIPESFKKPSFFVDGSWFNVLKRMAAERMAEFVREIVKDNWDVWARVGTIEVRVDGKGFVQAFVVGTLPPVLISAPV